MDFAGAIKAGFQNYANFRGVASRAAFWYWRLFLFIVNIATTFIPVVGTMASLALALPDLTITIRRSRDAGFSAWLQLLWLAPLGLFVSAFPSIVDIAQQNRIDFETASDAEIASAVLPALVPAIPSVIALLAVQLFFFVTFLLPTRTKEQGNQYVK